MLQNTIKRFSWFSFFLLAFLAASLLVACGETDPTPAGVGLIARKTPTPTNRPSRPTPTPTIAPPTYEAAEPTVTPLASPSPLVFDVPETQPEPTLTPEPNLPTPQILYGAVTNPRPATASPNSGIKRGEFPDVFERPSIGGVKPIAPTVAVQPDYTPENTGRPRIGIQAGHWQIELVPAELDSIRDQRGAYTGGVSEVQVTLDLARRIATILQDSGVDVDLLPATVPIGYKADAFISIHADSSISPLPNGYKLARSRYSVIPTTDDRLLANIEATYALATNFRKDHSITTNMTNYYAFHTTRYEHSVSSTTPAVILETGFLSNAADRMFLLSHPNEAARGVAYGILAFLGGTTTANPAIQEPEQPIETMAGIEILRDDTPLLTEPGGTPLIYVNKGDRYEYLSDKGDYYMVWMPLLGKYVYINRLDGAGVMMPRQ